MKRSSQTLRLALLAIFLGVAFAALAGRLAYLHVVRSVDLGAVAVDNTSREVLFEPRRGDIVDAKGKLLATSVFVKTVCCDPTRLVNQQAVVARAVAPVLGMSEADLYQRLLPRWQSITNAGVITNRPVVSVVIKRKVSTETWLKVQQTMASLDFGLDEKKLPRPQRLYLDRLRAKGLFTERVDDQLRVYPHERLAAHVLGGVGSTENYFVGHRVTEITGVDGIERTMNSKLSGIRGWRQTEIDVRLREQVSLRGENIVPHDGLNVVLTIDSVLQSKAEEALAEVMEKHTPVSASCMVVRPRTGEILAMASLPNFDPSKPDSDVSVRRNRLIADIHEPGSTFKIIVVSGSLNDRIVSLRDSFFCEHGVWVYAGKTLHDHPPGHGPLSVSEVITHSSNIGAAKIALRLGPDNLFRYMTDFGIGTKTGIPLLGEEKGIVRKVKDWQKISITRIAMGQEVAVTPLQMVMAMCAIANNGVLMKPMLVDRFENREGAVVLKLNPQPIRRVISETAAHDMVQALKTVVTTNGTAEKAALEHHIAAGKTGTAQKAGKGGYLPNKYFSSFIGFFPADRPELCIAVFLDDPREGYYGGRVAAPIFKQLGEYAANYLNIPPDFALPESATNAPASRTPRTAAVLPRTANVHD